MSALQVGQGFMTLRSRMVRPLDACLSSTAPLACKLPHFRQNSHSFPPPLDMQRCSLRVCDGPFYMCEEIGAVV